MTKIALDAGHGIDTYPLTGGKGVPGMAEFEFNSAVAGYAKELLEPAGYEVVLTQPLDADSNSLKRRVDLAIYNNVDFLISIHADYNSNPQPRGYWIFHWHESDEGKQFAETWLKYAQNEFGHPSRGIRACNPSEWCNFYMIRETHKAEFLLC